jgi:3',5'-cyclic AMP phosphodiesterase CpdA
MNLTVALVSDLHFGPEARYEGKLRKLTSHAPALTRAFVRTINDSVKPDLVVNLGDNVEDESREVDLSRYIECQAILRSCHAPLVNVAGNHDTIHIPHNELLGVWQRTGQLYYALDFGGWHFCILHTVERKDLDVRIAVPQLCWLADDLAAHRGPTVVLMHHSASEQELDDSRWFRGHPERCLVQERAELRQILEASGQVRAVFNGHLHRNHIDVIGGIAYITVQSLIENLDDDSPGRPACAHAVARLSPERMVLRVAGAEPIAFQLEFPRSCCTETPATDRGELGACTG